MAGPVTRLRQPMSAKHRKGLKKVKALDAVISKVVGQLEAGNDLNPADKWTLEELKAKLVSFHKWTKAEWLGLDPGWPWAYWRKPWDRGPPPKWTVEPPPLADR
jgi:hypothetical protein